MDRSRMTRLAHARVLKSPVLPLKPEISKHLPVVLLLVALVALAGVGCSRGDSPTLTPGSTGTAVAGVPTATPQPSPTATTPPPTGLNRGGIVSFAIKEAPPHQDVHQSVSNILATWGAGITYSRLLRFQRGAGVPVPSRIPECDLCESWVQTGPLEFEFYLRQDATWPDEAPVNGRNVTAQDLVYSFERQGTEGWPNAELMANIKDVTAIDETTVRVQLSAPDAELFEKLANGRSVVVAREVVELNGDLFDGPTIGSGPWSLEESSVGTATFSTNSGYNGGDLPYVDGLRVQYVEQDSTRAAGVRAGVFDFAETSQVEVRSAIERFPELMSISVPGPGTGVELTLNSSRSPLDSPDVRRAIFSALDLRGILLDTWGGEIAPSVGLNLPDPAWAVPFNANYGEMFGDISRANELLNDAGLTPSDRLTIIAGEFGADRATDRYVMTAELLGRSLNDLGLATAVLPVPTRLFADNVWLGGDYDIFVGAPPPIASLSGQLFGIYHSDGPWNTSGFNNAELDRLIEAQTTEMDWSARGELLRDIQDEIMSGTQRFFVGTSITHWLSQPVLRDLYPDTSGASGDFLTKLWLDR